MARKSGNPPRYLLHDQLTLFGAHTINGFGTEEFYVREVGREVANSIVRRHHYSGKVVNNSFLHLGVFVAGELLGVLQFGYAMNPHSMDKIVRGTKVSEYTELNRMWLDDRAPKNSESRAISYAVKYIRRARPRIKWIQSFADERCRLFGCIYRAANFLYVGEHRSVFYELDGVIYHKILMTTRTDRSATIEHLQANADRAKKFTLRQFRYIYLIKRGLKKDLLLPILPYPNVDDAAGRLDAPLHAV